MNRLIRHYGLNERIAGLLVAAGFRLPNDIRTATDEMLLAIDGIGQRALNAIRAALGEYIGE